MAKRFIGKKTGTALTLVFPVREVRIPTKPARSVQGRELEIVGLSL